MNSTHPRQEFLQSVLQCVAVFAVRCTATIEVRVLSIRQRQPVLQCVAVCWNILQYAALCCSVLQHFQWDTYSATDGRDQTQKNYDFQNFQQNFTGVRTHQTRFLVSPQYFKKVFTEVKESSVNQKSGRKTVQSRDPNIWSVISSVSGVLNSVLNTVWLIRFQSAQYYGVTSLSRINEIIGLFFKRALSKRRYSAKETCNLINPTDRSHPIHMIHSGLHTSVHMYRYVYICTCTYTYMYLCI